MKRYRARLSNGRVIGPFEESGIRELALKKRIDGTEDFQEFPTGDWFPLSRFSELESLVRFALEQSAPDPEATFVRKLSELESPGQTEEKILNEGKHETKPDGMVPAFPKEFNYHIQAEEEDLPATVEEIDEPNGSVEEDSEETETELKSGRPRQDANQDKTVVSPETLKYLEEQKKIEREKQAEEERKAFEQEAANSVAGPEEPEDLNNDSTQLVSLRDLKGSLLPEMEQAEEELEKEEKKAKKERLAKSKREAAKNKKSLDETEAEESPEETKSKKKRLMLIAAAAFFVILMLPEEKKDNKPKKFSALYPQITFPQQYEAPDANKAAQLFKKGVLSYSKGTYPAKMSAASDFRASLENKFKDNPAAAKLIFVYSELLKHSDSREQDAARIFKLVQIFGSNVSKDADLAAGMALFYLSVGKAAAAVKTVEKFNTVKGSKPTVELFSVFLRALKENGDLVKAKAVEEKLAAVAQKPLYTLLTLFDYYKFTGEYEKAANVLVDMEKKHGETTAVMLRKASLFLYKEDFGSLAKLLAKIRAGGAENSKFFYSKYLEYYGMVAVKKQKPDVALKAFKKALELNESLELRSRLAALSANSTQEANQLINESKAVQLLARSKNHWKNDNFKFAFKDALEATRIAPTYLPAKLHLAGLQKKQSYFTEAIATLEKLYDDHPHNSDVVFGLIDAYIEAYKFEKTKKLLGILAASELRSRPEYFAKMAKYYVYRDEFGGAVNWLRQAINLNPLDDENTYELAKMFIRYRKYNQAKILLNKAMELDPSRVDFRVSYADIVYETDGADAAIGYLYDVLRDFPDNAMILSSIGIYYYRSGQIKMFKSIKEKLLKLPDKDTALFEFLIKAAKMDERYDDVIKHAEDLIEINPGDLRVRLFLGQVYMEMSKYEKALEQFNAIKDRLPTYPKLQYFLSKLFLLTDNVEKATELAKKEIEGNPTSIDGYLLLAEILKEEEKYIEAEKQYKKAQRINPKNVDMLVGLAYINFMKSQYEIALDLFKKAKGLEPGRADTHKLLGDVYRKIGQSALAVESYKMFLELSPNSSYKQNLQNYINVMQ